MQKTRNRVLYTLILVVIVMSVIAMLYRHNGPTFIIFLPEAITTTDGAKLDARRVRFSNFLPGQWSVSNSAKPLLEVGDTIRVVNPEQYVTGPFSLRIHNPIDPELVDGRDVQATYFINISPSFWSLKGEDEILIRIVEVVEADAFHQNDELNGEWFWLREFYQGEILYSKE